MNNVSDMSDEKILGTIKGLQSMIDTLERVLFIRGLRIEK